MTIVIFAGLSNRYIWTGEINRNYIDMLFQPADNAACLSYQYGDG